ncbi:hypothetical protein IAQ61_005675 [Plenodomus lingam]|uniref:uncharacterized protein n=1 Tax=Leptosphaeria maculans TaxID=5022 RepID=UPI003319C193|nr:hypothetical protein IAQ61_005675 [Plenodomus lingam]
MQATQDHATTTTGPNLAPLFIPGVTRGSLPVGLLPPLDMPLTFLPQPSPSRAGKRSRAAADIDGEHSCLQKKKRRLRLLLITSRLSPQFSHPATNIVDRGSSKIAVWAKQKALGRNLLRKAAILNRIRRQTIASSRGRGSRDSRSPVQQEKEREQLQLAKLEFDHGAIDTYTRPVHSTTHSVPPTAAVRTGKHFIVSASPSSSPSPSPTSSSPPLKAKPEKSTSTPTYRSPNAAYAFSPQRAQASCRDHSPLPPSPLGLSNYDAFDREGGPNRYNRFDDDDDELQFLIPYNDDDGDDDDVPFSPSAATSTSITMAAKSTDQAIPSPLLPLSPNLKPLDPNDSVFGAYDRVDDSVDETWPTIISPPQVQPLPALSPGSTSPNFPSVLAPAQTGASWTRSTDSFAVSPNLGPRTVKPPFPSTSTLTTKSPFTTPSPSLSSNLLVTIPTSQSPNFTSTTTLASTSTSTLTSRPTPLLPRTCPCPPQNTSSMRSGIGIASPLSHPANAVVWDAQSQSGREGGRRG